MESFKSKKCIGELVKSGFYDPLVLIGFPYDLAAKQSNLRAGAAYGPDCFRRFLHKLGPIQNAEYGVDLSTLAICDYGNITAGPPIDLCFKKLRDKVRLTMGRGQTTFVMGGTRDLVPHCAEAVLSFPKLELKKGEEDKEEHTPTNPQPEPIDRKVLFVSVSPSIETDVDAPTQQATCMFRKVMDSPAFSKLKSRLVVFGVSPMCDKENLDFLLGKGGEAIWMQDIRKAQMDHKKPVQTQAGQAFEDLLEKSKEQYDLIYVSFNLESVLVRIHTCDLFIL